MGADRGATTRIECKEGKNGETDSETLNRLKVHKNYERSNKGGCEDKVGGEI